MKNCALVFAGLCTLLSAPVHAAGFERCPQHFPGPPPRVAAPSAQRELCFDGFAVLHSGQSKTPVYVVERLNSQRMAAASAQERTDAFYSEARLPQAERARLEDYRGSRFDRGHMAPAGDMASSQEMAQSFSLANVVPQDAINNRKPWAQIEKATRSYARRAPGDVFVFSGPIFDSPVERIGTGRVWVPSRLFKVVYTPATGRAWAYLQANTAQVQPLRPLPYGDFVASTGIDVLPGLKPR
jgi:endonuclease G, mitochondrial